MSAQIIQSVTLPPVKRQRTANTKGNMFKCGEVFVTNCADKWTFYCSHCQLATTDVGVFVCHIRLKHMNDEVTTTLAQETPRNSTPITIASSRQNVAILTPAPPATSISIENVLPSEIAATTARDHDGLEQMHTEIVKEEPKVSINQSICSQVSKIVDISSLAQRESNNATPAVINENIEEDIYTINEIKLETQDILSFENENETNESDKDEEEDLHKNDSTTSYYNPKVYSETQDGYYLASKEDSNDEFNDSSEIDIENDDIDLDSKFVADNDKDNKPSSSTAIRNNAPLLIKKYYCFYCSKLFNSKRGLNYHIKRSHLENNDERVLYKCSLCPQTFQRKTILNSHQKTHNNEI